jgi:hypothetical protein
MTPGGGVVVVPVVGVVPTKDENARIRLSRVAKGKPPFKALASRVKVSASRAVKPGTTMPAEAGEDANYFGFVQVSELRTNNLSVSCGTPGYASGPFREDKQRNRNKTAPPFSLYDFTLRPCSRPEQHGKR